MLTIALWFAISLGAVGLAFVLVRFRYQLSTLLSAMCLRPRFLFVRWVSSSVVIRRGWWCSNSVTMLQFLLFLGYLAGNGLYIGLDARKNFAVIARRCGIMSSINMIPLFLAGRPSLLVSFMGLPLHVHHLLHYWIGRVSILEAILHTAFVLAARIDRKQSTVSGIVTAAALGCILIFSVSLFRIYYFEIFLKVHHFLAIVSIGALLWHVIRAEGMELKKLILPLVSILLWLVSFIPFLSHLRIRSREVVISKFYRVRKIGRHEYREVDVMQIDITLRHPVGIKPGQWAYLRVQDFYLSNKVQTHPFMISWWTPAYNISQRKKDGVPEAQSLTMLVRPVNGLTRRLSSKTFLEGVSFDGPLGQDLRLEKYDNVFLAVKGIGITGVLSYAKHLVELESRLPDKRRIRPRKLDLYWELEDNSQEEWAGPFLRQLQLKNDALFDRLLQLWCYFPSEKTSEPLVELYDRDQPDQLRKDFQYFYPSSKSYMKLSDAISIVAARSVGQSIVVACGVSSFVDRVRTTTLKTMSPIGRLDFVETEYRPRGENLIETIYPPRDKPKISGPVSLPHKSIERTELKRVTFI